MIPTTSMKKTQPGIIHATRFPLQKRSQRDAQRRVNASGLTEKYCWRCEQWLVESTVFFYRNSHKKGGLTSHCKKCNVAANVISSAHRKLKRHDNAAQLVTLIVANLVSRAYPRKQHYRRDRTLQHSPLRYCVIGKTRGRITPYCMSSGEAMRIATFQYCKSHDHTKFNRRKWSFLKEIGYYLVDRHAEDTAKV